MLKSLLPDNASHGVLAVARQISPDALLNVLLVLLIFYLLNRGLGRTLDVLGARSARARMIAQSSRALLQLLLWGFAFYICVRILAPSQNTVLVAFGSAALAIGFGTQDLVRNWTAGLVIMLNHPFRIGDRIRIGRATGEVIQIGLNSTRLYSFNGNVVIIPNAEIWDNTIYNSNDGAPNCMTVIDVYLPIDAPVDDVLRVAREAAATSPFIYLREPIRVAIEDQLNETPQMRLRLRAFVYDHRLEYEFKTDVACRIKRELARLGIASASRELERAA